MPGPGPDPDRPALFDWRPPDRVNGAFAGVVWLGVAMIVAGVVLLALVFL